MKEQYPDAMRASMGWAVLVAFTTLPATAAFAEATDLPGASDTNIKAVCDDLVDAPRGLYGLCAAYCESRDYVALLDPAVTPPPPNPKVVERFNRIAEKAGVPELTMPCMVEPDIADASVCPAFTGDKHAELFNDTNYPGFSRDTSRSAENRFTDFPGAPVLTDLVVRSKVDADAKISQTNIAAVKALRSSESAAPYAYVGTWTQSYTCSPVGFDLAPCENFDMPDSGNVVYLTPAEFLGCREIILQKDIE